MFKVVNSIRYIIKEKKPKNVDLVLFKLPGKQITPILTESSKFSKQSVIYWDETKQKNKETKQSKTYRDETTQNIERRSQEKHIETNKAKHIETKQIKTPS